MKPHLAVILFGFLLMACVAALSGCSLYISIEGKPKQAAAAPAAPTVSKEKPKTRYEQIKEAHNNEWLNLPHRESENQLFEPK